MKVKELVEVMHFTKCEGFFFDPEEPAVIHETEGLADCENEIVYAMINHDGVLLIHAKGKPERHHHPEFNIKGATLVTQIKNLAMQEKAHICSHYSTCRNCPLSYGDVGCAYLNPDSEKGDWIISVPLKYIKDEGNQEIMKRYE